jgi:Rieske Fe-S protein
VHGLLDRERQAPARLDQGAKRFVCPCQTSIWDIQGKLLSGPSPRNLDTLPAKVEGGRLLVRWQQYKVATPQKVVIG